MNTHVASPIDASCLARFQSIVAAWVVICIVTATPTASAVPNYSIVPLGLTDAEHTRDDDYKYSEPYQLNEAGHVIGSSNRYNGGSDNLGYSTWLYDGATTVNIGLTGSEHTDNNGVKHSYPIHLNETGQVSGGSNRHNGGASAWLYNGATTLDIGLVGSEHTRDDDYKDSYPYELNEAGQVGGSSNRYNGDSTDSGRSAWLYDGTTTLNIGLVGSEYTGTGDLKYSDLSQLNEAGQVSGSSYRYNGGIDILGLSAWLYDGTTTLNIGLAGSEHTGTGDYKASFPNELNEAGQVSGTSARFNGGSASLGYSAWLYNGATTIDIGLVGSEHTHDNDYKANFNHQLNEAGQVSGYAYRYNGGVIERGRSAWLYDGVTTVNIGLAGSEHTGTGDYKYSDLRQLNEAGQVIGYSNRFNGGSTDSGKSAWHYNGATTVNVGLTDSEHTGTGDYKYSDLRQLNEAGQVIGYSNRFNGGSTDLGKSAWLYDGTTTVNVGLTDSEHTGTGNYKYSDLRQLNEAGQVIGYSNRFNGGSTDLGQDAWFYDPELDQTYSLSLSTTSEGFANSTAVYLGEDGLVLGYYTLFDDFDNELGQRAFYFTIADGLHDLGSLVDGGLTANGWDWLANAMRANGSGQIFGHGKLTMQSDGQMAYLLTPVPEPNTAVLGALAGVGLLWVRRRRVLELPCIRGREI